MLKPAFLTIFVLLACSVALMEGQLSSRERCVCKLAGTSRSIGNLNNVAKIEYLMPSGSCSQEELRVYFKKGPSRCLNFDEKKRRRIRQALMGSP